MILWAARGPTQGRALVLAMLGIFVTSSVLSLSPEAPIFATTICRREAWDGPGRPVALPSVRRSGPEPGPVGRIAGYLLSSLEASGVTVLVDARPGDAAWGCLLYTSPSPRD